jgi:hypothetical protein
MSNAFDAGILTKSERHAGSLATRADRGPVRRAMGSAVTQYRGIG